MPLDPMVRLGQRFRETRPTLRGRAVVEWTVQHTFVGADGLYYARLALASDRNQYKTLSAIALTDPRRFILVYEPCISSDVGGLRHRVPAPDRSKAASGREAQMPNSFASKDSATLAIMRAFRPTGSIGAALAALDPPWVVLRQGAFSPLDGEHGQIYGGIYIVLHPAKGVALVDLAPAEPEIALPQLRRLLCGARPSEYQLDQVPLVAVSLAQVDLAAAEDRVSEAFARTAPCTIQDGSWIEVASKALASRFPALMHVKRAEFEPLAQEVESAGSSLIQVNAEELEPVRLLDFLNPSTHVKHWENLSRATLTLLNGSLCAARRLFRGVHRATTAMTSASLALLGRSMRAGCTVAGRVCRSKAARDLVSTVRALPRRSINTVQRSFGCAYRSAAALGFASTALLGRSMHAGRAVAGRLSRSKMRGDPGSGVRELPIRLLHEAVAGAYRRVLELLSTTSANIVGGWGVLPDAKSVDDRNGIVETDIHGSEAGTLLTRIETTHWPKSKRRSASRTERGLFKRRFALQSGQRFAVNVKSLVIRLPLTHGWIPGAIRPRWREATAIVVLLSAVATSAFFDLRDVPEQTPRPRAMAAEPQAVRPVEATTNLPSGVAKSSPLVLARPNAERLEVEGQRGRVSATLEGTTRRADSRRAVTAIRREKREQVRAFEHFAAERRMDAEAASIAREQRVRKRALLETRSFSPYDGPEFAYANRQIQ